MAMPWLIRWGRDGPRHDSSSQRVDGKQEATSSALGRAYGPIRRLREPYAPPGRQSDVGGAIVGPLRAVESSSHYEDQQAEEEVLVRREALERLDEIPPAERGQRQAKQ